MVTHPQKHHFEGNLGVPNLFPPGEKEKKVKVMVELFQTYASRGNKKMPQTGNITSCVRGDNTRPTCPPKEEKLVRIGSNYFSKSTHTEREFNLGVEVGKTPGGMRAVSLNVVNELVVNKECTCKPLNKKKLPTSSPDTKGDD